MTPSPGIEPGPHWWEASAQPLRHPCSPDALSRYPITQFIMSENNVSSATFVDILPPVDVSAYLVTALGTNSILLRPSCADYLIFSYDGPCSDNGRYKHFFPYREHLPTTSQTEEPLTLLGSNRQDFITLQLQDPTLKLIRKYLSAGNKESSLHDLSFREQTRIQNLARS